VTHEREKAITPAEAAAYWKTNAEAWTRHSRAGYDVHRDAYPAFLAMLPPVSGLLGLDIGCREGSNARELARLGASMQAVDVAPTFIRHALAAERAEPRGILFHVADAFPLPFADGAFAFVRPSCR
jgi:SAM-dependent methyltransferase